MTNTHTHNADPAKGQVCSHLVTDEMLVSWGFTTEVTDKVCGSKVIVREGMKWHEAVFAAWGEHVRMCCRTPAVTPNRVQAPESAAEMMAFAESILRPKDRRAVAA